MIFCRQWVPVSSSPNFHELNSVFTTVDSFGGRYQATVRQGENGVIAIPATPVV